MIAKTWIVVAESSRARIFAADTPLGSLEEIADLAHPHSRLKGRDLSSDSPGRAFDSAGQGRHAMSKETDARRHESEVFAQEISGTLESGRTSGKFGRLVLIAPPEFLGVLRNTLSRPTQDLVEKTINKNIVRLKPEEIRKHLGA